MKHLAKIASIVALACAVAVPAASAQGRKSLRINEVMVVNTNSVIDDHAEHSAWIEILNPTHAPVEISSIYLTNDPANLTKYYVPRGDADTKLGKGQAAIFFANGNPNHGTFHTNFTLTPGVENTIYMVDADGIAIIDSVTVPANLPDGCSYARNAEGEWTVRDDSSEALAITPGGANTIKGPNNKVATFAKMDSHGFAMTIIAMVIVFGALFVLCLCFVIIRPKAKADKPAAVEAPQAAATSTDDEVAAAIAMALHQHLNAGIGNARLTINHNHASAWASKAQGMRQYPIR